MNFAQYEALCTEAIALLGTESKALTPTGNESLQLNGATLDLLFDEPQSVLSVVCHLGQPSEEHRTQVYEQLLHLQMLSLHLPGVRFGYDPRLDEVLFCSSTRVGKDTPASWLATLMTTMAAQAQDWRSGMLDGQMAKAAAELEEEMLAN